MLAGRQRMLVEAVALAVSVFGCAALLVASCIGRDRAQRSNPLPEPAYVETTAAPAPPETPPSPSVSAPPSPENTAASTTTILGADAGARWVAPVSGMAAHSTYDPELNPVTPNGYPAAPLPSPRVPRDAGH